MIDSEKRIMTLRRPAGQPRTERLPTEDRPRDCGDPLVSPVPRVDVRVVLFTVRCRETVGRTPRAGDRSGATAGKPDAGREP